MNLNEVENRLHSLSLDQLSKLLEKLENTVQSKKAALKEASKAPPRNQSDIEKLADLQGLDLSGLMREISKR
ncbi:MAG: hypothetical protein OIF55_07375 [Amphritea sp.]|nr:hypothetical protein [Amphritea sp.]